MGNYIVDVDKLIQELSIEWVKNPRSKIIPRAFHNRRWVGDNFMMSCPYHDDGKPSFGVHREPPYYFNCFACGAKGTVKQLVAYVHETSQITADRLLNGKYGVFEDGIDLDFLNDFEDEFEEDIDDEIYYTMEEKLEMYRNEYTPHYMWGRGVSERTADKYELGLDVENNSIVFPVRNIEGRLEYFIRRRRDSKFYKIDEGIDKTEHLYGLNYLVGKTKTVYLVEGTIDVQSCYEAKIPAVALLGRFLSDEQINLLQRAGVEEVVLFLDNDKFGTKAMVSINNILMGTSLKTKIVKYPGPRWGIDTIDDVKLQDPNDLLVNSMIGNIEVISNVEWVMDYAVSKYNKEVILNE